MIIGVDSWRCLEVSWKQGKMATTSTLRAISSHLLRRVGATGTSAIRQNGKFSYQRQSKTKLYLFSSVAKPWMVSSIRFETTASDTPKTEEKRRMSHQYKADHALFWSLRSFSSHCSKVWLRPEGTFDGFWTVCGRVFAKIRSKGLPKLPRPWKQR